MADEVTSHNSEVLTLCVRFVDAEKNIREELLSFTKVLTITGAVLAADFKRTLENKE